MDILFAQVMGEPLWMWLAFLTFVLALLAFDLGVLHRRSHEIGIAESLKLSAFYIGLGVAFSGWVWHRLGSDAALDYLTGFVVEQSLAMDNIFVIAMIFGFFGIPRIHQHRVLFWGILGVIVLRGIMIVAGAAAVTQFDWVLYLFAGFLVITGVKMLFASEITYDIAHNPVLIFLRRHLRVTQRLHGDRFFVRHTDHRTGNEVLFVTPLFLTLVMVELADVVFAVDSIPAIFAITTEPYVVYTSNIFAILGLRSLFFALSAMIHRFAYLRYALALILVFIGAKIFVADMLGLAKVPPMISLSVTLGLLAGGIAVSLWRTAREARNTAGVPAMPGPARARPEAAEE
ncbi:TerC family protein [Thalassobaculum sp.]|uniref:TerC family protein n=1 Tax=Thalassobaculum sp. TaxID=2022740 RepID=UPI003B58DCB1